MIIDKSVVKKILVITLSNVGDIVLTTPVIGALHKEFPKIRIDCLVGPSGKEIFEKDPNIFKVIIYDKHLPILKKRRLQLKLKRLSYDLIVDLRNTIFPILLGPKYRTATIQKFPKGITHSKQKHLFRLKSLNMDYLNEASYIHTTLEDDEYVLSLLMRNNIKNDYIVINPGAKSHLKRWPTDNFAIIADMLINECGKDIIFVGLTEDEDIIEQIVKKMSKPAHNFVNKTSARQLACLLKRAKLLITNDSAPLHIGCAVGGKVLSIFGPTNPDRYGPTGEYDIVISAKLSCSPCEKAVCEHNYECMKLVDPNEVFETARLMVEGYE